MTGEVGELVLRDNYEQATALGNAVMQAHPCCRCTRRMRHAGASGQLNRELEALPTDKDWPSARARRRPDGPIRVLLGREDQFGRAVLATSW